MEVLYGGAFDYKDYDYGILLTGGHTNLSMTKTFSCRLLERKRVWVKKFNTIRRTSLASKFSKLHTKKSWRYRPMQWEQRIRIILRGK